MKNTFKNYENEFKKLNKQ
ncbi:Hypothetical protein SSCIU_00676 [Mammaliicoccus sciuri]|nr:Hypothetical protein SSCIU_00676 [Mammaliicoccus sciuri]